MTDFGDHSPRRYFVDSDGRHVLIGLTPKETPEFETLDIRLVLKDNGNQVAWGEDGILATARGERRLELYGKHDKAWRRWMVETYAERRASLGFVNQDRVI